MQRCIVIADDDPTIITLVKLRLGMARYNVVSTNDAIAAMAMVRSSEPVAVILDVQMPGGGGLSALAKIKADPFASGRLISAISSSLHVDAALDPLAAVDKLRSAVDGGLQTYSLPVVGTTIKGNAVLVLGDGAQAVLDYFRGVTDTPPATT